MQQSSKPLFAFTIYPGKQFSVRGAPAIGISSNLINQCLGYTTGAWEPAKIVWPRGSSSQYNTDQNTRNTTSFLTIPSLYSNIENVTFI